jgi:SAM-dependent methyltransferase
VESVLLERYRVALQGAVLELVPGGSRLTEELVHQARAYNGLGPSSAVIGVCRQMYRTGKFTHGDLAGLDQFDPAGFDAVVAGRCALDVVNGERRLLVLEGLHRVLSPGGVLIFSSHNALEQASPPPAEAHGGRKGGGLLRGLRLRSSRAPMDERELGNELLSGIDGELTVQYQIGRQDQEAQLNELGFQLVECLDLEGHSVASGTAAGSPLELHYVARPAPAL